MKKTPDPLAWLQRLRGYLVVALVAAFCLAAQGFSGEPSSGALESPSAKGTDVKKEGAEGPSPLTVAEARARSKILHETYESTLQAMHRRYFKDDARQPVPSRVLEEVFTETARRSGIKAHWLAVNASAMSLDHEPRDEFEKQAVRVLTSGKAEFEQLENGTYRRAGAITLFSTCLKCHAPPPLRPDVHRVAGLVISVPLKAD